MTVQQFSSTVDFSFVGLIQRRNFARSENVKCTLLRVSRIRILHIVDIADAIYSFHYYANVFIFENNENKFN